MKNYYTNVQCIGNYICFRGIVDGKRVRRKIEYQPTLYVPSSTPSQFKTLHGEYLSPMKPGGIYETRDFIKQYKDVSGFTIYGNQSFEYAFIAEEYTGDIDWDNHDLNIAIVDIEVGSENGFPEPEVASEEITAITIKTNGIFHVFGCGEYKISQDDVRYHKCQNERDLIKQFLDLWTLNYPDGITGWNTKFFDFPYIINRIRNIFGEKEAARLSPWGKIWEKSIQFLGREQKYYEMSGISMLDYLELFRRFSKDGASQDSYKLDAVAHKQIGERKLSYEEYENLHQLYRLNYQKFIDYNIQDCRIIERLDEKEKLLDLALTLAYDSKSNWDDVNTQVRMWDAITFNHLLKQNIIVPPKVSQSKDSAYEGAYVKDPIIGRHAWVASFDLTSLYPMLIQQYNLSPDMIVEPKDYTNEMNEFLSQSVTIDNLLTQSINTLPLQIAGVTATPNRQLFRVDRQGFLSEIMEQMYGDRAAYKNKMLDAEREYEACDDANEKIEIKKRITRFNNLQMAKKVALNSAYGACGSQYFRFYDLRIALAVTMAGQLSIRWIQNKLNGYMNKICQTEEVDYVIASDTDSIYLSFDRLVGKVFNDTSNKVKIIDFMDRVSNEKIQPFLDKSYNELRDYMNAYSQKMKMKREALCDAAIWTAKKRYILNVYDNEGVRYAKPKVKISGLEMKKSSTPAFFRDKMLKCVDIMLGGTEDDMIAYIKQVRQSMKECDPAEIAFPRGVNGITEYADAANIFAKGSPIHVRGSLIYNHLIKKKKLHKVYEPIKEGDKIKFIYLIEPNPVNSNIISFLNTIPKEFDLTSYIDVETQFTKAFLEPVKIILDCIGWQTEKTASLESFFT